jgi:hypothetical protein
VFTLLAWSAIVNTYVENTAAGPIALTRAIRSSTHAYLRPLVIFAAAAFAVAVAFAWDWIERVGLAPILLAALWCAAISALGVVAVRRRHRRQSGP